ncbi:hypothetical protein DL93DRAFT_2084540 [Clavulina sp. PMI_390]|nr:hypothetical protein DL93DRAFT_2084540 [Clavulina sp. PMI_390]
MVGVTAPCLEKLSFTWQAIERDKPRLDALRTLTRSYDNYAAYRAEYSNAHTSGATCIPVIGIYLPQLRSIVTSQNDFITISSPHTSATSLINFAKCRAMAEICRTALQFQARPPKREEVSQNLEIQAWILEQLEVGNSKPDAWYNEYSKDVQKQELEHGDIRSVFFSATYLAHIVANTWCFDSDSRGLEAAGF